MSTEPSPSPWLVAHAHLLPRAGEALDVACGRGRNAFWLAARGLTVEAIDRDADLVRRVQDEARRCGLPIEARVEDLEQGTPDLGIARFDVVAIFNYLHRPLFPRLVAALRPAGLLLYETFTREQALRGRPRNPAFLLEDGELRSLVAPLAILDEREGDYDGRCVASIVARK